MILKKMTIKTFGGLFDREIELRNGLNIILGPNESGKSTIYHAIERTLFTPSKLTPSKLKRHMERFLPIGGGDTIEVSIDFEDRGGEYSLRRRWGKEALSELKLPGGSLISDDNSIQEIIGQSLGVPEGTCRTVMMTYQSGLSRTIDDLKGDRDTLESLGDLLRKAVMEMDGVSVDAFRSKIEDAYRVYLGRWDLDSNYPENNRGIENPWKKGVGSVVEAFYEKERLRLDLESAQRHELQLDKVNREIFDYIVKMEEAESFLEENRAIKEDAEKRRQLEAELKAADLEYQALARINKDWPVIDSKVEEITEKLPDLEEKLSKTEKERAKAEKYQENKELLERFKRAKKKKQAVDEAKMGLAKIRKITKGDLKNLRKKLNKGQELETSLSAGKLFATFTANTSLELEVQKGVEEKTKEKPSPGEPLEIEAEGVLRISHPDWDLEVTSGAEYAKILEEYERAREAGVELLKELGVKDLDEAEAVNDIYEKKVRELENAKTNLEEELGNCTYDELKKSSQALKVVKPSKDLTTLIEEMTELRSEISGLKKDLEKREGTQADYVREYGSQDQLIQRLAKLAGEKGKKQKELNELKPLPAGIEDVDEFIKEYEKTQAELETLKEKYNELINERIRLESTAPDRSVEEFQKELAEVEEKFNRRLKKGKAIARIKQVTERLLEEMDKETYTGLEQHAAGLMEMMTGGRYGEVVMRETIPTGLQRKDGMVIPYDYLSFGTIDILGLALRLAITKMFLGDRENLVIMDDPLVDLDPDRQSKAADAIKEFAESKQVILLTCHPSHAKLLGGNLIELEMRY
ncbi:MAG: AAA family ATPase [Deltaproteobacteria bacterium]|nr:AAA family ATPase [Deltaproteobacteria bacterium]